MNAVKPRNEADRDFMWDLSPIFASKEDWDKAYAEAEKIIETLPALRGTLTESAEKLADGLEAIDKAGEKFERVAVWAFLAKSADNSDPLNQECEARAMNLAVKFSTLTSFASPEILAAGKETLTGFLDKCPRLRKFRFMLEDLIRTSAHILDAQREEMLSSLGDIAQTPSNCYHMLTEVDMDFPSVKDSSGKEYPLSHGTFGVYRESTDRALRENTFETFFGTYKKFINTFAATYSGEVKFNSFAAKVRGFGSACESALNPGNVPVSVYDALTEAIHGALPTMRKYIDLRAALMKKEKIDMFDLYVPMIEGVDIPMPYEDGKKLVKEALKPLGEEYGKLLDRAYSEHWIDVYETKGKTTGAFSCGVFGVHPYVLLNYTDALDDAFTLAHELGHAMHSYFSDTTQEFATHDYKIMVAEVASTVNEVLLTKYLLAHETDKGRRAYILNHFLEGFRTTVFRQTLFAEFERRAHEMYAAGQPLTAQSLCGLYKDLISTYYEGAEINDIMQYEWAFIPHFYRNFYVYQYATGFCSAVTIASNIINTGDASGYLKFLTTGGSDYPLEELKIAGIDLTKPKTVADAMKVFDDTVEELKALMLG